MTQTLAQQIIDEASQDRRVLAELDTRHTRRATRNTGYRIRLTLKPEHLTFTIKDAEDWPPIRDTWQELLAA